MSDFYANSPMTFVGTFPGLIAGSTTTVSTTGAIDYAIKSKGYRKATISNGATPTTDVITGAAFTGVLANKGCIFVVGLNAAGSIVCTQGTITDLDTAGAFKTAAQFGPIPDNFCPIGYVVIKAGSTANNTTGWVFGTSNNSGVTGITYAFVSIMGSLPDRPQIS